MFCYFIIYTASFVSVYSDGITIGLGKQIKSLRKQRNLTQAELAELMDIDESALRRLEIGKITNPKLSTLLKLCNAFKISLNELIDIK
ncbi:MAG: helix-turn-helix transcriptional regulator [Flavobacteriales bacterium]|nr:helix-turn-helix transcriptional regulator [Flavobacteriales bacterium]